MGGSNVLMYAINHPEDVVGALAMCPVTDIGRHWQESLTHPDPDYFMKRWLVSEYYGVSEEDQGPAFRGNSVIDHAHRLTMPVVISHAADDSWLPVAHSDRLAESLTDKSDFRYFRYEEGDHFLPSMRGF